MSAPHNNAKWVSLRALLLGLGLLAVPVRATPPGTRPSNPQANPPSALLGNSLMAMARSAPPPMTFGKGPKAITGTSPQAFIPDPPKGPPKSKAGSSGDGTGNALLSGVGAATLMTAAAPPKVINDFNVDGQSDLLWRNYTSNFGASKGNLTIFPVNGSTVQPGSVVYNEPSIDWQVVGTGDFEGTGNKGILYWNSNPNAAAAGEVWQILMNGTTIKAEAVIYTEPDTHWQIVAVADFDGDGKADILWRNSSTGAVYLMPMNGQTVLPGQVIYTEPRMQWQIVAAADFDGDGKADILWWNSSTGEVFLQLVDHFTIKSSGTIYQANTHWMIAGVGDFNGDGKADILWRNAWTDPGSDGGAGGVWISLIDGTKMASGASQVVTGGATVYTATSSDWQIMAVGDYDGDQKSDFIYFNNITSQAYLICMNGLQIHNGSGTGVMMNGPQLLAQGCAAPAMRPMAGPFTATDNKNGSYALTAVFAGGLGVITPGNLAIAPGGTVTVNPSVQTTYTLTITNGGGVVTTTSVSAGPTVVVPAPVITQFTVAYNKASSNWTLAATYSGGSGVVTLPTGNVSIVSGGTLVVSPTVTTVYTLTVTNAANTSVAKSATATYKAGGLTCVKTMVYGFGQLLVEESPQGRRFVQSDQVGTVNLLSDANGVVRGRQKALPFGERMTGLGETSVNRYAGHEDQPGSAIYMQARMYLPVYGKFAQPDPAYDQNKYDPETWNLYGYVANNPVTHADPTGLATTWYTDGARMLPNMSVNAESGVYDNGGGTLEFGEGTNGAGISGGTIFIDLIPLQQTGNKDQNGQNQLNVTDITRKLDSFWARLFAPFRGDHSGTIIDDGQSYNLIEVERIDGKAVAKNRTFDSMDAAKAAFGHGPESGKDFEVDVRSSSTVLSGSSATATAQGIVDSWNAKGLAYPMFGMDPGNGQGNCHAFTHYALETLGAPHPEQASRSSGWYQMNFGWDRGKAVFIGN